MTRFIAVALSAILLPNALAQDAPAPGAAPATPAQAAPAASAWPQKATVDGTTYLMNAPAYTAINGNTVSMRATVQVKQGDAAPVDGTVDMTAVMAQAADPGYVELSDFRVASCDMPDGSGDAVKASLGSLLAGMGIESMLTNIVQGVALDASRDVTGLSNPVPAIRVTERPAVLVSVTGEPVLGSCGGSGWKRVVNTPSILLTSPDGTWVTRVGGTHWLGAPSIHGRYAPCAAPPQDVVASVGKAPPPPPGTDAPKPRASDAPTPALPEVVVATKPTLLVSMDGAPKMGAACDGVEWATNCTSPLLRTGGTWWTLGSGRWFSTGDLANGPWTHVPATKLPAAFANLPAEGPLAVARASVPGTLEAKSAAAANGIVRAVTVQRDQGGCRVRYRGGQPRFKQIDGGLEYAANATQPVIKADGAWYCCDDGAWFKAGSASGPWAVCDSVPASVYAIPPSCPAFACTYVTVVSSTPESVTFGSSAGYLGTYMQDGVPVYGTGYDYNATDPQPVDQAQANVESYVAPSYPTTYGNQAQYSYDTGTYAPDQGYGYYGYADMYPSVYDYGYGGWGWSPYWGCAYGYGCGWGYGWGYGDWGRWNNNWNNWDRRHGINQNNDHRLYGDRGTGAGDRGPGVGNRGVGAGERGPGVGNRGVGAGGRGPGVSGSQAESAANRWSSARGDGTPGGYNAPRGYNAPQGYNKPQGYNAPQGYNKPQGYNAPQGYNKPQGYNSPQGYHSPQGYNSVSGFNQARYGGTGGYRSTGGGGHGGGGRR